jgi:hypothetical protein
VHEQQGVAQQGECADEGWVAAACFVLQQEGVFR